MAATATLRRRVDRLRIDLEALVEQEREPDLVWDRLMEDLVFVEACHELAAIVAHEEELIEESIARGSTTNWRPLSRLEEWTRDWLIDVIRSRRRCADPSWTGQLEEPGPRPTAEDVAVSVAETGKRWTGALQPEGDWRARDWDTWTPAQMSQHTAEKRVARERLTDQDRLVLLRRGFEPSRLRIDQALAILDSL